MRQLEIFIVRLTTLRLLNIRLSLDCNFSIKNINIALACYIVGVLLCSNKY